MPQLTTPDGVPVEPTGNVTVIDPAQVDREFSRAMATDDPGGVQGPPRREEKTPEAQPRRRGRPPKNRDEQARVADKPPEPPAVVADKDYAEEAAGLVTLGWAAVAAVPWTTPYAVVIAANAEALTAGLANGARHNPRIREALDKAATGGGGVYMIQLAGAAVTMAFQSMELLRDPALRQEATVATRKKFREFLAQNGVKLPEEAEEAPQEAPNEPVAA